MSSIQVRRRIQFQAATEYHLDLRVETFRQAVRIRGGAVLVIERKPGRSGSSDLCLASILYRVPFEQQATEEAGDGSGLPPVIQLP